MRTFRSELYIYPETAKRIRTQSRAKIQHFLKYCNQFSNDLTIAMNHLTKEERNEFQQLLHGDFNESIYQRIIYCRIVYDFIQGVTSSQLLHRYSLRQKGLEEIFNEVGMPLSRMYIPDGMVYYRLGTKLFKTKRQAEEEKERINSDSPIKTLRKSEAPLYRYMEKHQIQISDITKRIAC